MRCRGPHSGLTTLFVIIAIVMMTVCPRLANARALGCCPVEQAASCCDGGCCCSCPGCSSEDGQAPLEHESEDRDDGECDCPLCGLSTSAGPSIVLDADLDAFATLPPIAWARPVRDDPLTDESACDILHPPRR